MYITVCRFSIFKVLFESWIHLHHSLVSSKNVLEELVGLVVRRLGDCVESSHRTWLESNQFLIIFNMNYTRLFTCFVSYIITAGELDSADRLTDSPLQDQQQQQQILQHRQQRFESVYSALLAAVLDAGSPFARRIRSYIENSNSSSIVSPLIRRIHEQVISQAPKP